MTIEYPADEVLLARGRYSTITAERKALMKAMQKAVETIANSAHRILRAPEDLALAQGEATRVDECILAIKSILERLAVLAPLLAELQLVAWPKDKREDF